MVRVVRYGDLLSAYQVCRPSETRDAAPIPLTARLKAVSTLVARYGYREGASNAEQHPEYLRVLAVDLGADERLIVCRDELQVVHQKRKGRQWHALSYHQTLNNQLQELMGGREQ